MSIILNVQGQIFQTDYDTIIKIPYFKDMFDTCGIPTETIFVNRPSHIFKHIIGFATDPLYPYPEKYKFELDFYGIDYEKIKFYDNDANKIIRAINDASYIKCNYKNCTLPIITYNNHKLKHCKNHCSRSYCNIIECTNFMGWTNENIICDSCQEKHT